MSDVCAYLHTDGKLSSLWWRAMQIREFLPSSLAEGSRTYKAIYLLSLLGKGKQLIPNFSSSLNLCKFTASTHSLSIGNSSFPKHISSLLIPDLLDSHITD